MCPASIHSQLSLIRTASQNPLLLVSYYSKPTNAALAPAGVAASQWLSLRLQLMAASMVSCIAVLAVLDHMEVLPSVASQEQRRLGGAGLVGLSLSYALPLTGLLNQLLTTSAETEQEMVAVERILEYTKIEPQVIFVSLFVSAAPSWSPTLLGLFAFPMFMHRCSIVSNEKGTLNGYPFPCEKSRRCNLSGWAL